MPSGVEISFFPPNSEAYTPRARGGRGSLLSSLSCQEVRSGSVIISGSWRGKELPLSSFSLFLLKGKGRVRIASLI